MIDVPKSGEEVTPEMIEAGLEELWQAEPDDPSEDRFRDALVKIYRAMRRARKPARSEITSEMINAGIDVLSEFEIFFRLSPTAEEELVQRILEESLRVGGTR